MIATLPPTRANENSLLGNDYDPEARADAFASCRAVDPICQTFDLSLFETRSPDASWIKTERWNDLTEEEKASLSPICPDFVIELRSASDTLTGLKTKMQEYIKNGVSLGWLINRQNRNVYVYRPNQEVQILENP